jgi:hypothetical protein
MTYNQLAMEVVVIQQYFSYIMKVNFIAGGNRNTRRKPPTCHTFSVLGFFCNSNCPQESAYQKFTCPQTKFTFPN